jgi:hypothetical protein
MARRQQEHQAAFNLSKLFSLRSGGSSMARLSMSFAVSHAGAYYPVSPARGSSREQCREHRGSSSVRSRIPLGASILRDQGLDRLLCGKADPMARSRAGG